MMRRHHLAVLLLLTLLLSATVTLAINTMLPTTATKVDFTTHHCFQLGQGVNTTAWCDAGVDWQSATLATYALCQRGVVKTSPISAQWLVQTRQLLYPDEDVCMPFDQANGHTILLTAAYTNQTTPILADTMPYTLANCASSTQGATADCPPPTLAQWGQPRSDAAVPVVVNIVDGLVNTEEVIMRVVDTMLQQQRPVMAFLYLCPRAMSWIANTATRRLPFVGRCPAGSSLPYTALIVGWEYIDNLPCWHLHLSFDQELWLPMYSAASYQHLQQVYAVNVTTYQLTTPAARQPTRVSLVPPPPSLVADSNAKQTSSDNSVCDGGVVAPLFVDTLGISECLPAINITATIYSFVPTLGCKYKSLIAVPPHCGLLSNDTTLPYEDRRKVARVNEPVNLYSLSQTPSVANVAGVIPTVFMTPLARQTITSAVGSVKAASTRGNVPPGGSKTLVSRAPDILHNPLDNFGAEDSTLLGVSLGAIGFIIASVTVILVLVFHFRHGQRIEAHPHRHRHRLHLHHRHRRRSEQHLVVEV